MPRKKFTTEQLIAFFDEGYRRAIRRIPPPKPVTDWKDLTFRTIFYTDEEIRRHREKNGRP